MWQSALADLQSRAVPNEGEDEESRQHEGEECEEEDGNQTQNYVASISETLHFTI